ncbi:MAG: peptide chain release factor N(5)-glutamine methyltransferase, partial [Bacteroidia bacterium]|nr:peptide chain release factor N(5)-glutamine methyltransferase [Bacteroidia bacterium]
MQIASNKIKDVIRFFKQELEGIYEDSEIDAFVAICFEELLNLKRSDLLLNADKTMSESELLKFNFAIKDLKKQKPLQYILGVADFYGLKFKVNGSVLIPRPETEELVDLIIKEHKGKAVRILDIGTGSGCIPVSLKKHLPLSTVDAIDVSPDALKVAEENAKMNDADVHFSKEDILNSG